jgi:hypothetical protein
LAIGADWIGKRIGEDAAAASALTTVVAGILEHLGGDAAHHVLLSLDAGTNHDLEFAIADAVRRALKAARAHFNPPGKIFVERFDEWFDWWDDRIRAGLASPEATSLLFRSDEPVKPLALAHAEDRQWWPAFRPVLLRWAVEQTMTRRETLAQPLDEYFAEHLVDLFRQAVREVLREEKHQRGWIAWQQDLLETIATQSRNTDSNLADRLIELARHASEIGPFLECEFGQVNRKLDEIRAIIQTRVTSDGQFSQPDNIPSELLAPNFTGRIDDLEALHKEFLAQNALEANRPQAVTGLGGVGKTQLAIAYAERYSKEYFARFWSAAESASSLYDGWSKAARLLARSDSEVPAGAENLIYFVRAKLKQLPNWLFVFDDFEDSADARPWLFLPPNGHVLITSRRTDLQCIKVTQPFHLDVLPSDAAVKFLMLRTGCQHPAKAELDAMESLAEELGGLPLALEQAAAYVVQRGLSLQAYIEAYKTSAERLIGESAALHGQDQSRLAKRERQSVLTTWALNFEAVRDDSPHAIRLLETFAFLAREEVPDVLTAEIARQIDKDYACTGSEPDPLGRFIAPLVGYSLVRRLTDGCSVHQLVQGAIRRALKSESSRVAVGRTVAALYEVMAHGPKPRNTEVFAKLACHARVALGVFEGEIAWKYASLASKLADYYEEHHRYTEAEPLLKEAIQAWRTLDASGAATRLLGTLAGVYEKTGRLEEAERCYAESVDIQARLASENPEKEEPPLAARLDDQANFYRKRLNRFAEAEKILRTALRSIRACVERDRSEYNRKVLSTILNSLAILLSDTQRREEAERCQLESVSIDRQLASENPDLRKGLATVLANLAILYNSTNRTEAAILCHEESLQMRRSMAAEDPSAFEPDLAHLLVNLALTYGHHHRFIEAERCAAEALAIYRRLVSATPGVYEAELAWNLGALASFCTATQKLARAEGYLLEDVSLRRELASRNRVAYDDDLAHSLANLGYHYERSWRITDAATVYQEALSVRRRLAGELPEVYEPELGRCLNNYGVLLEKARWFDEAEALYNEALTIRRRLAGRDPASHLDEVAATLNNLGVLNARHQRLNESARNLEESLAIYRRLAEADPCTHDYYVAYLLGSLGDTYRDLKRFPESIRCLEESAQIRRRLVQGNEAAYKPELAHVLHDLGVVYGEVKDQEASIRCHQESLALRREFAAENPQAFNYWLVNSLIDLGTVYSVTGDFGNAERSLNESLEICRGMFSSDGGPNALLLVKTLNRVAELHLLFGRLGAAESAATESIAVSRSHQLTSPAEAPDFADALFDSTLVALNRGNRKAAARLREALSLPLREDQRESADYLNFLLKMPRPVSWVLLRVENLISRYSRRRRAAPLRTKVAGAAA